MQKIIKALIVQKRSVFLVLILLIFLGCKSYLTIAKEDSPSVQIPVVIVSFFLDGISTEDSERLIIKPTENYLRSIDNIKKITATAAFNGGHIIVEFRTDTDINKAIDDVKEQISKAKKELPPSIEEPTITEINLSEMPILNIAVTGNLPTLKMLQIARKLRDDIKEIPSILDAKIIGERKEEIEIILNPISMNKYKIDLSNIQKMFTENNNLIAAGKLKSNSGQHVVQINSVIKTPEDILDIPIKISGKKIITVKDIAEVKLKLADAENEGRINSKEVISIQVKKKSSENIIEAINKVKAKVLDAKKNWPPSVGYIFLLDASEEITESVRNLENNIILAVILTLLPLFFTLGFRPALLVAISIPLSFLSGIFLVNTFGYTMNNVVTFSLILSIGMLVDASIVVCEYADIQLKKGIAAAEAYAMAAEKMWWPIFGSTITTLIVYLPLFFWPGVIGKFMYFMPLTIIFTVGSSLIIAFSFIPVIGESLERIKKKSNTYSVYLPFEKRIIDGYEKILRKILQYPQRFVKIILSSMVLVIILFKFFGAGFEFFPKIDSPVLIVSVKSRDNLSLKQVNNILKEVENLIAENLSDQIKNLNSSFGKIEDAHGDEIGRIYLELKHWKERQSTTKTEHALRKLLANYYGAMIEVIVPKPGPPNSKPFTMEISSDSSENLLKAYKKIIPLIIENKNFIDIESNYDRKTFQWDVLIDKNKIGKYGISTFDVGSYIQLITKGLKLSSYRPDDLDREVDIVIKLPERYRNLKQLTSMIIPSQHGLASFDNFLEIIPAEKISSITRVNGKKSIQISANLKPNVILDNEITKLKHQFEQSKLPDNISINFTGESADQEETGTFLSNAFLLALVAMYLVMLIQFNSYYQTSIVMSAVFLSTIGVLLGLIITGQTFGVVMCGVGIISLAGVVVNNNIIFLDTYNDLRSQGFAQYDAIIETGKTRIRPILLTAVTAVLGLLPMILGVSINFIDLCLDIDPPANMWWKQLAITISGGLTFATILTLFFTPTLLMSKKDR